MAVGDPRAERQLRRLEGLPDNLAIPLHNRGSAQPAVVLQQAQPLAAAAEHVEQRFQESRFEEGRAGPGADQGIPLGGIVGEFLDGQNSPGHDVLLSGVAGGQLIIVPGIRAVQRSPGARQGRAKPAAGRLRHASGHFLEQQGAAENCARIESDDAPALAAVAHPDLLVIVVTDQEVDFANPVLLDNVTQEIAGQHGPRRQRRVGMVIGYLVDAGLALADDPQLGSDRPSLQAGDTEAEHAAGRQ